MNWSDAFVGFGTGRMTEPGGLKDAALSNRMAQYKRQVAKRYRVLTPDDIEGQLPKGNLWISTKMDGELWFLVKRGGEVALCAYNGRVLQGVPATAEADQKLKKVESIVIAGELLSSLPGMDGRPRCYHVSKALSDPTLAGALSFHAFDLVEDGGGQVADRPYGDRLKRLRELLGDTASSGGGKVSVVTTQEGDAKAAAGCYREWVATQKFEGVVIRSEQGLTYKIKPTFTIDALVVAFGERVVNGIHQLRELELALKRDDGSLQILGSCGGGFSEDDRSAWREKLDKLVVPSVFRLANREGTLCRFVEPKVIVEIKCNDLVETDGNDVPVARMALNYEEGKGYSAIGPMPIPSLLSPVFQRERTDKTGDVGSVGLDQIFSRLPFGSRFNSPVATARSVPEIVKRGVYVKGTTAVRKFVAIATHRAFDRNYPPFVVHFTDFSSGRAEPLKVTLRVASKRESIDQHIATWIEENVKRGWVEYGSSAPAPAATAEAAAAPATADAAPAEAPAKPKKSRAKKATTEGA